MEIVDKARAGLLSDLVKTLSALPRVVAIVLGGSYAEGAQTAASDMDIGLYYRPGSPFDPAAIRAAAEAVAVQPPTVTEFYAWGPWVNGGAWIQTAAGKVDFLYRNLDQVEQTIQEAQAGIVRHDFDQQPTFGFYSVMYLAETRICRPLYDPDGVLTRLKESVAVYPPALKQKAVADSLWSVEFSLLHADTYAGKGDVYNTVGCLTRCATNLAQALFALNETYFLTDKRALRTIATFALQPEQYGERLCAVLACPGSDAAGLQASTSAVRQLWRETGRLAGEYYKGSVWTL
jgi:hypothetical protein